MFRSAFARQVTVALAACAQVAPLSSSAKRIVSNPTISAKASLAVVSAVATAAAVSESSCESMASSLESIKADLEAIKGALGISEFEMQAQLEAIKAIKKSHPNNLAVKHFDFEYFKTLSPSQKKALLKIVNSGVENADSGMGCYAMNPGDYDDFLPFFEAVIKDYHKIQGHVKHITNWDLSTPAIAAKLPAGGKLDLTKLGLGTTSMRVRVGRNLASFPLPGAMNKQDRVNMENSMIEAFKKLIADPAYGGSYYSLTPGSPYEITPEFYKELVKKHIMFKDMADDSYLAAAGIASDWPHGRGVYVSADKGFIVWCGEEDHLRIMCMKKGTVLNEVFDRLKDACGVVEKNASKFAHSEKFGFVTSCPTNLGTGMRASLHIKCPNLCKDGTDEKPKSICKPLGLSVRGLGGEHTPIGADGTIDISPSARLMIQEAEIICALYEGIERVLVAEKNA
mmetsp:Transcript_19322/g.25177  ORF Transcript_19322/g.25177 Transcript_19322/m.25177 type:complete len:454 (+) Transcript_19322:35-1396(+)